MTLSTAQLLAPQTIRKAISQLELPGTSLQNLFGWGLAGGNTIRQAGRNFSYDIFNVSRQVATARVPAQAMAKTAPQSVKNVTAAFPRCAERITLLDEDLLNRRQIGGDSLDRGAGGGGEVFVTRQEAYLAQRFANVIEFQTAAMLRGSYAFSDDGDLLRHSFSGGGTSIDFRIPAGNKSQLNMLSGGNIL